MALGKRIRDRREALNLSQGDLAKILNVQQGVISALEIRDSRSSEKIIDLAKSLNTTVEWLMSGKKETRQLKNQEHPKDKIVINLFNQLSETDKRKIMQTMEILALSNKK